mgnify:CR=1 FL=1
MVELFCHAADDEGLAIRPKEKASQTTHSIEKLYRCVAFFSLLLQKVI